MCSSNYEVLQLAVVDFLLHTAQLIFLCGIKPLNASMVQGQSPTQNKAHETVYILWGREMVSSHLLVAVKSFQ